MLIATAGCVSASTSGNADRSAVASEQDALSADADGVTVPVPPPAPPPVPCRTPTSAEDINSLPGYPELVAQVHVTGRAVPSDFGLGDGSEIETTSSKALIGNLPNGLRIYTNASPDSPSFREGDYVMLLGSYDVTRGIYFLVGGYSGVYAARPDGLLHQQCVIWPGQTGATETSDGVALPELLSFVTASMTANADKLAEIMNGVPDAVIETEGVAQG